MQNNYFNKTITVDVLEKPHKNSNLSSQIVYGEKFKVISENKNFLQNKKFIR